MLTGRLNVEADTTVEDAVIFDGDATIDGSVSGNAVAFNGDVVVNGDGAAATSSRSTAASPWRRPDP